MLVIAGVLGAAYPLGSSHMDATLSYSADSDHSNLPPALVFGTSDAAIARGERSVLASGLRIGAALPIAEAQMRLERQGRASAIWLEVDEDCGGSMDALLSRIALDVRDNRYAAVISTSGDGLDSLAGHIDEPHVEMLVNPDDAERLAALAVALASHAMPSFAQDIASDNNAERLRQLREEVSRIASTLARLSAGPGRSPVVQPPPQSEVPPVSAETVAKVIRAR